MTLTFNYTGPGLKRKMKLDLFEFYDNGLVRFERIFNLVRPFLSYSSSKLFFFGTNYLSLLIGTVKLTNSEHDL